MKLSNLIKNLFRNAARRRRQPWLQHSAVFNGQQLEARLLLTNPDAALSISDAAVTEGGDLQFDVALTGTGKRDLTPTDIEGPYYAPDSPRKSDFRGDVTKPTGWYDMVLTGRVVNDYGVPIANAFVDVWHADAFGVYDNSSVPPASGGTYKLRGHVQADSNGIYTVTSIMPNLYEGRTRHVHLKVFAPEGHELLNTQLYFATPYDTDANFDGNADTANATTLEADDFYKGRTSLLLSPSNDAQSDGFFRMEKDLVVAYGSPPADITVDVNTSNGTAIAGSDYSTVNTSLTFKFDGPTTQTVTVSTLQDDLVEAAETLTATLSNASGASLADATATGTINNDDTAGFTVTESGGSTLVSESGTTDSFTVALSTQPASNVVITVASGDTGEATVDKATLTFTSANWNVAQTVTVTGVDDPAVDGNQTTNVTLSIDDANSDDAFDALANQAVSVTTTDDDTAGFTVTESGGSTLVSESGTTDTFTVALSTHPASDVVITVASGDTGEATVDKATLTFTNANWNVAQTVTVTGVDDSAVDGNQTTNVTLSIDDANSDNAFDALANQTVNVTTTDDDTAGFTVTESGGSTLVSESGTTDTFTVVLSAQPASDVVITVASGDTGEATVDKATLTFTSANWNVAQTVTVTGVDDSAVDGNQTTNVTLSIDDANSDDAFDALANQTVSATTTDDDTAGFTVTEGGGNTLVSESGTTDSFTVVLSAQPASDVVITVASGDTGEATVDKATLTFTSANWNVAQTVTVTGVDDSAVDGNQTTNVTLSIDDANSDDAFDALADQAVSVTTTDDDAAGFTVTESGGSTLVSESGTTDSFTVVLSAQPASDVVITVASGDTGEATVDKATLTFTSANWNTAQPVTVTGVDDSAVDGNQTTNVTLSVDDANSDDAFDALANQTVSVTTTDDDTAGFTVIESGGSTLVSESGTTDTITVVLSAQPASDVVITVVSGDTGEATVDKATLTFTSANWNTAQTVTVTGVDDSAVDGNQASNVTLSIDDANSDDAFDALANQTVSVTTTDDDAAGFTVTESGGSTLVSESGTTDTFTVVLTAMPLSNVVVSVASGDSGEATVGKATLTFTSANWNTPQTVTVTGVDDSAVDGNQTSSITLSIDDANSDDAFDALANQTVSATTTDDDAAGFTVTESGGSTLVSESGTTDTFTVVLTAMPLSNVVVSVASGDSGEATVDKATLTFTSANWNTPQTVAVTGVDDSAVDGNQTTNVTLSVNDANSDDAFDALADQTVAVLTTDNDPALGRPTLTNPSGSGIEQRPTLQWETVAGADTYEVWVNLVGTPNTIAFRQSNITGTSFQLPTELANNSRYRAWVRAHNSTSSSSYSNPQDFTVGSTPGATTFTSVDTSAGRPTFVWSAADNAVNYDLWVNQVNGTARIIREQLLTSTSFSANTDLPDGQYKVWVRASNAAGFGQWTSATSFSIGAVPGATTVTAPSGTASAKPTFTWTVAVNAVRFELWVNQVGGTTRIVHETSLATNSFGQPVDLPAGSYRTWVRAIGASGALGPWSPAVKFTV